MGGLVVAKIDFENVAPEEAYNLALKALDYMIDGTYKGICLLVSLGSRVLLGITIGSGLTVASGHYELMFPNVCFVMTAALFLDEKLFIGLTRGILEVITGLPITEKSRKKLEEIYEKGTAK